MSEGGRLYNDQADINNNEQEIPTRILTGQVQHGPTFIFNVRPRFNDLYTIIFSRQFNFNNGIIGTRKTGYPR
ncbi:hypothetical protein GCM10022210_49060 [Mucilaginibacter dorajii]|uniref:TonB-dependent receptor n=1 Tax=Mucilaginibacter dorajii TaxID=692994 RepID=A0ABP7QZ12_9SPHI